MGDKGEVIYSLVSREQAVLAEYTAPGLTGNFSTVTRVLLKKIDPAKDAKLSYVYDKYVFHYMVADGLTYLCMSDKGFSRLAAYELLKEVQDKFIATYGERARTAIAFAFNADFQRVLKSLMEKFNSNKNDKVAKVQQEINNVKSVMVENIDKVLERGEKIELLVDKTEILDQHAFKFQKNSKRLRKSMWWKNVKLLILIAFFFLAVLFIVLMSICGPKFDSC